MPSATGGQVLLLHLLGAVHDDGVHAEDRQVQRRRAVHARARRGDLLEHRRGLADALAAAAVALGDGDADPAAGGHRVVELPREAVLLVARRPVVVVEAAAHRPHRLADLLQGLLVGHGPILADRAGPSGRRQEVEEQAADRVGLLELHPVAGTGEPLVAARPADVLGAPSSSSTSRRRAGGATVRPSSSAAARHSRTRRREVGQAAGREPRRHGRRLRARRPSTSAARGRARPSAAPTTSTAGARTTGVRTR